MGVSPVKITWLPHKKTEDITGLMMIYNTMNTLKSCHLLDSSPAGKIKLDKEKKKFLRDNTSQRSCTCELRLTGTLKRGRALQIHRLIHKRSAIELESSGTTHRRWEIISKKSASFIVSFLCRIVQLHSHL